MPDPKSDRSEPATDLTERALPVLDVPYRDVGELLYPEGGRRQPLKGFREDYVDIVHYIVRCTHDIWEKGDVGLIYTHYTHTPAEHRIALSFKYSS